MEDKEINAISAINAVLVDLEPELVSRVLRWAAERYNVELGQKHRLNGSNESKTEDESKERTPQEFVSLSDLYDAADPSNDPERVLVVGYWFQTVQGQSELESQQLNKELKQMGHGVEHMPHTVDDLMNAKPRLMIQLKKQGTTRQARRKFKLTTEGIKKVKEMLNKRTD